jgi:hypothetical protein
MDDDLMLTNIGVSLKPWVQPRMITCFPACFMLLFLYLVSPQLGNKCSPREIIQLMLFSKLCISAALGAPVSAE